MEVVGLSTRLAGRDPAGRAAAFSADAADFAGAGFFSDSGFLSGAGERVDPFDDPFGSAWAGPGAGAALVVVEPDARAAGWFVEPFWACGAGAESAADWPGAPWALK